jgi:hypothetical protein
MGVYLRPLFSDATIQVTCDYDITYSWYANSVQLDKEADCYLDAAVALYRYDGAFVPVSMLAFDGRTSLSVGALGELLFDFGSVTGPMKVPLQAPVSSEYFYFVVVSLTCQASGAGWPGSLAGASAIVTVPSITVTVTARPVVSLP